MERALGDMASLEFDDEANALYLKLRKGRIASSERLAIS
jgi:hypothetical protein